MHSVRTPCTRCVESALPHVAEGLWTLGKSGHFDKETSEDGRKEGHKELVQLFLSRESTHLKNLFRKAMRQFKSTFIHLIVCLIIY